MLDTFYKKDHQMSSENKFRAENAKIIFRKDHHNYFLTVKYKEVK